jgi:hypothetical protein
MSNCSACKKEVVWLMTKNGRQMPVDAETVKEGDKEFDYARHTSHFATCPAASYFRKKK